MRKPLIALLYAALAGSLLHADPPQATPASSPAPGQTIQGSPSAFETDPSGWIDLFPAPDLHDWKRVAYPGKPLKNTQPWSVDSENKILHCDGTGTVEMFLSNREFADGIFHVEWCFKKIEGKKGYNSGVFVRNSDDGQIWHQAQVMENAGYLFGSTMKDGKLVKFRADDKVPQRIKPAGEWNVYEVTCKGKMMTLWINGGITATWNDCEVPKGFPGLEAEGWLIDFRNIQFKEIK